MTGTLRVRIVVRGRVQGVGFRYATVTEARRLGLAGWARNAADGSVEMLAEGDADAVRELIAWCHHGPPSAHVTSVRHTRVTSTGELGGFGVKW